MINWRERLLDARAGEMHINARMWVVKAMTQEGETFIIADPKEIELCNPRRDDEERYKRTLAAFIAIANGNEIIATSVPLCKLPAYDELRPAYSYVTGVAKICTACDRIVKSWLRPYEPPWEDYHA